MVRSKRTERGSVAIEFALVGTLMVMLMAMAMDFSRIFFYGISVANAARAGAQWGILSSANMSDFTNMQSKAAADANGSGVTVTTVAKNFCDPAVPATACGAGCGAAKCYVRVTTTGSFQTVGSYPFIPNPVSLSATVTMRAQ